MSNQAGKGSTRRPMQVSNEDYANRWDAIFQRDQPKPEPEPTQEPLTWAPHDDQDDLK